MPAPEVVERFGALADLLTPGDLDFPAPSTTDAPALIFERFAGRVGENGVRLLLEIVAPADLAGLRRLEREEPALFFELRFATYFSYYQQREVIEALQRLGHDYHAAPQPLGYALEPFDVRPGRDLPANPRGSYKPTDRIERIDTSPLPWFGNGAQT
jgi:hypothetical protein